MKLKGFVDAADLAEDKRITMIGETAMKTGGKIGFVTDSDPGKAERYIKKLLTRYPQLTVIGRCDGPTEGMVTVSVQRLKEPLS